MPIIIGLTGGIGAGKSTVALQFAALGAGLVDADAISRALTVASGLAIPMIARTFGVDFIGVDGALDRNKMREAVFNNAEQKLKLEAILHPLIRAEMDRQVLAVANSYPTKYVVAEIPLLFASSDYFSRYDRIAVVDCTVAQQLSRVKARSNLSAETALPIIAAQTPRQLRLQLADDVISNDGDGLATQLQVSALHEKYLKLN